jgi:holdfast attachment protein HfaA
MRPAEPNLKPFLRKVSDFGTSIAFQSAGLTPARETCMTSKTQRMLGAMALGALTIALAATASRAQSISSSSAQFNAGYGRTPGAENRPVDPGTRDANGNRVIIDGVIQTGADQSVYARAMAFGAGDAFSGAGAVGGATAIGNNLVVITQGNWNTVIVNSTQTNNGDVSASTDLTGTVVIDHD